MDTTQPSGLVHGRINLGVGDSSDAGRIPDIVGLNGKALFTATVDKFLITTPGAEMIIIPAGITADIVNGALQWLGQDDVPLVANLDATGKSLGWQWAVSFTLTNSLSQPVTLVGWRLDVAVYDPNAAFVNGENPTITQLTAQAPVVSNSVATLAKGDPGPAPTLIVRNVTTTTDPASATVTFTPTGTAGSYWVDYVNLVSAGGGGGGTGTVVKVAGVSPDGAGNVTLTPANIGAPTVQDNTTAQATASNALTTATNAQTAANSAQTAANAAQTTANSAVAGQSALAPKDSPTFTGDPKAPTPVTTDNDTSIATTAFVRAAIAAFASAGTATQNVLVWNATTQVWTQNGVTITARPTLIGAALLLSTNDATVARPSWMAIGDSWIQHPDAP